MYNVKGKWALLTGASRGIGYEIAISMAKQGCNLILHSRKIEHLKQVEQEVKDLGVETYCVTAELSDHQQVVSMLDEIEKKGTQVDIILNNAGIQVPYRENFWVTPPEDYDLCFKVNMIAVATICHRLIPAMIKRGTGRIINTTSGIELQPEQAAYSASKAALDKFTVDLGYKLNGTDVILSLVDPGWCRTDLGGPNADNSPESAIPGVIVGAFIDDKKSGKYIRAQDFSGMDLEVAVAKAEQIKCASY